MASIRDTPAGELLRICGFRQHLQFREEKETVPAQDSTPVPSKSDQEIGSSSSSSSSLPSEKVEKSPGSTLSQQEKAATERMASPECDKDHILVDWDDDADADNPRNWNPPKKAWVTFIIW